MVPSLGHPRPSPTRSQGSLMLQRSHRPLARMPPWTVLSPFRAFKTGTKTFSHFGKFPLKRCPAPSTPPPSAVFPEPVGFCLGLQPACDLLRCVPCVAGRQSGGIQNTGSGPTIPETACPAALSPLRSATPPSCAAALCWDASSVSFSWTSFCSFFITDLRYHVLGRASCPTRTSPPSSTSSVWGPLPHTFCG